MNLTNYHSHTLYCDGRAGMEDFIRFAISRGFTSYGISSHAPLPFPTHWTMEWDRMDDYLDEFTRMKEKYASEIELAVGLEIDYLNEDSNPSVRRFQELPLDYRIGSVHLLYNDRDEVVDIDVCAEVFRDIVDQHFGGDLDRVIHLYYDRLLRMVELGGFDILGHADKMHHNAACYRPGLLERVLVRCTNTRLFLRCCSQRIYCRDQYKSFASFEYFLPERTVFPVAEGVGSSCTGEQ